MGFINNIKIIYKMLILLIMCIGIFFLSINGILSNNNIAFSFIIFVIGILFFIYGIIYTIKNKSINYFIFTPFLLIMFCIVGTYYGQIPHNRINEVADEIKTYDQEHDGIDFDVLLNKINVPKKMDIIKENGEIIIFYKDFIFFVNRNRYLDTDYFIDIIKENNVIINDNKDLVYYVLKEGYLETNNK